MKYIPSEKQINISGRIWHELKDRFDVAPFIYAMYNEIDLNKYGDGLSKFYFTFIVLKPERPIDWTGTYFNVKKREAEIALEIPYDQYFRASEEEAFQMMQDAYLEGIDLLKTMLLQKDFNVDAFKRDVQAIFSQPHWYKQPLEVTR